MACVLKSRFARRRMAKRKYQNLRNTSAHSSSMLFKPKFKTDAVLYTYIYTHASEYIVTSCNVCGSISFRTSADDAPLAKPKYHAISNLDSRETSTSRRRRSNCGCGIQVRRKPEEGISEKIVSCHEQHVHLITCLCYHTRNQINSEMPIPDMLNVTILKRSIKNVIHTYV